MAHRSTLVFLAVSALGLPACRENSTVDMMPIAGASARPRGEAHAGPAPSFDECYPWMKGGVGSEHEPPMFQLSATSAPGVYLMIVPGLARYGDSNDGWDADFPDSAFEPLWDLGKRARQQHPTRGEKLVGEDPRTYFMSISCGGFYQWHATVTETFAQTGGEDAAAELARQLFDLVHNPPLNAVR